jgi:putative Mg2+ transporter-C (MgtC) family protein
MDFSLPDIAWGEVVRHLVQMAVAYLLVLPTAVNREASASTAGVRTFPLVAVATCGYMLVGLSTVDTDGAWGRLIAGLVAGMGFIGGGAILKNDGKVAGLATAAALWSTGAIGIAVAWHRYEIAISLAAINYFTLSFGSGAVKKAIDVDGEEKKE